MAIESEPIDATYPSLGDPIRIERETFKAGVFRNASRKNDLRPVRQQKAAIA
ncbi:MULTISPECIES: hypothetical protein [Bradyrhizobium]|uniref:hypothetical protein n=1 Tax=Bradyrhizobium TaxID=374 RepID=UPI001FD8D099|nr:MULTISPECIES: hypothetical protein [Bradyrhizobium]